MDIAAALASLGGAARTRDVVALGVTEREIRAAVAQGVAQRLTRGVLALPSARSDSKLAARFGAQLTCVSALAQLELPLRDRPELAHLCVPRSFTLRGRDASGARLHFARERPGYAPVASAAAALDFAGDCLDETWHLVAVDAALNEGLITMGDVVGFRRTSTERRKFLLRHADARAEAPAETIARLRLVRAGFTVRPQAYVEGAGRVDLEIDGLLIVQVDGYEPHSGKKAFVSDREKSRAVIKAGRPQLSYAASELLGYYSADIARDVREALAEWNARDRTRIRRSGQRVLRISRDGSV